MLRMEKVNQLIKRELSLMIQFGEIKDPRVKFVTIQNVDVSKDLQHAHVKFSILSDDPKVIQAATEGLNKSSGYVRKLIAERVSMRYIPQFQFFFDKGVMYVSQVEKALEEVRQLKKAEDANGNQA